jgi:membrane protein DedA with SNARE-associated domain
MTDTLLALVPTYGLWLILGSVWLSCLALPIPSSMLVMAAGGFAASGDLTYWQVIAAAVAGFVAGDQAAYHLAHWGGPSLLARARRRPGMAGMVARAETLLDRRGVGAVFLSRTIVSPLGPYLGYLSGALGLRWIAFTVAAVLGAVCWATAYTTLGYLFADQITQIATIISNFGGLVIGAVLALGTGAWLRSSWKAHQAALLS